jgi:membrane protease YdiL (CAAX protease family)
MGHNARAMSQPGSGSRVLPWWAALPAAFLGAAVMVVGSAALVAVVPLRLAIVLASALLALPAFAAVLLLVKEPRQALQAEPISRRAVALAALAGLGLWVGSLGLLELQYAVWAPAPGYLEGFRRLHEALRPSGPLDAVWSLAAIAVAPAVFEELLVRGILLPSLRAVAGDVVAIVVSALFFALMHFDWYRFPFTLAVGLALGVLRVRTGSLWPSVIAHATLNALTFSAAPWLDDPTETLPDPRPWLGAALLTAGVAVSVVAFRFAPRRPVFDSPSRGHLDSRA